MQRLTEQGSGATRVDPCLVMELGSVPRVEPRVEPARLAEGGSKP